MAATNGETINGFSASEKPHIRLNVSEKAKTVISVCHSGTLCTTFRSDDSNGAPLAKRSDESEDMAAIRMKYSITHVFADQGMDSPRFAFDRIMPSNVYFVGGFSVCWPNGFQL